MKIVNKEEFAQVSKQGVVLVDFFATWCGPCKMLGPVLEDMANEYQDILTIVKVDVDEESDIAMEYGIMSVPTMILFKDGKAVHKLQGFQAKEQIYQQIKSFL